MAHTKKSQMPKSWPVPRKTRTQRYVAVPQHASKKSLNLLFVLRDVLKLATTRKEAKYIVLNGDIKVNTRVRKSETYPVQIQDTISLEKQDKYYRLEIVNKKFQLKEIKKAEASKKIVKILGKKTISKDKIQMNLEDGTNFLTKDKFSVGDSAVINAEKNKVEKILPLKLKAKVEIVLGKHAGEKGELVAIEKLRRGNAYQIKLEDKEVSLPYKTVLVIE